MPVVRDIEYAADGSVMVGTLAVPDSPGLRPAVLIAHEANGLDDHQKGRALQLAELGYVAFALDYHGGGRPPGFDDAQARTAALWDDTDRLRDLARAGLDVLLAEPVADPTRVAAIGYCFGGALVLELGRSGADLRAIVGFHPSLHTSRPAASGDIRGRVLVLLGADDPYVTADDRAAFEAEMRSAEVAWELHLYGGVVHTFTHPNPADLRGLRHDPRAAGRSWRAMLELFDEVL